MRATIPRHSNRVHPILIMLVSLLLLTAMPCPQVPGARTVLALEEGAQASPSLLWSIAPSLEMGPVVAAYKTAKTEETRFIFGLTLGFTRSADALPILSASTSTTPFSRGTRAVALMALGLYSQTATVSELVDSGPEALRHLIAAALGRMIASKARTISYPLLKHDDPEVQLQVADLHLQRGSRVAEDALARIVRTGLRASSSDYERALAHRAAHILFGAGKTISSRSVPALPPRLQSEAVWASYSHEQLRWWKRSGAVTLSTSAAAALLARSSAPTPWMDWVEALPPDVPVSLEVAYETLAVLRAPALRTAVQNGQVDSSDLVDGVLRRFRGWREDVLPAGFRGQLLAALGHLDAWRTLPWARDALQRQLAKSIADTSVVEAALGVLRIAGMRADQTLARDAFQQGPKPARFASLDALWALCQR